MSMLNQPWTDGNTIEDKRGVASTTKAVPNTALAQARLARGLSQQGLAEMASCNQSDIAKLETGAKRTTVDWMIRLAPFLEVEPKDLMPSVDDQNLKIIRTPHHGLRAGFLDAQADKIPIRSAGRGGGEQEMFTETVIGYTPRPAVLDNVREGYAVYMVGDSMEPRFEQGWLLYVNPFRPPQRGRAVVVYKTDNVVLIKRFLRDSGSELILEQLNPPEEIRIPRAEVKEIHLIVGLTEEGG